MVEQALLQSTCRHFLAAILCARRNLANLASNFARPSVLSMVKSKLQYVALLMCEDIEHFTREERPKVRHDTKSKQHAMRKQSFFFFSFIVLFNQRLQHSETLDRLFGMSGHVHVPDQGYEEEARLEYMLRWTRPDQTADTSPESVTHVELQRGEAFGREREGWDRSRG